MYVFMKELHINEPKNQVNSLTLIWGLLNDFIVNPEVNGLGYEISSNKNWIFRVIIFVTSQITLNILFIYD